jgi:uncharacterized protein YbjQ (UPF0145 family)
MVQIESLDRRKKIARCAQCGGRAGFIKGWTVDGGLVCSEQCHELWQAAHPDKSSEREQRLIQEATEKQAKLSSISLSTLSNLPGNRDYSVVGVVTAECVFGMNIFRDVFAAVRDVVGGRSDASEKVLKDLKATCLTELKEEAYKVGADAVLGIDLDYSEFSGGGKSMLFLVASGTAVKIIEDVEDQGSRPSERMCEVEL